MVSVGSVDHTEKISCKLGPRLIRPRIAPFPDDALLPGQPVCAVGRQHCINSLTGLPNLYKLDDDVAANDSPVVFAIRVLGLGGINGILGYKAGDSILAAVAEHLALSLDEEMFSLYKLPGEHFAVLTNLDLSCTPELKRGNDNIWGGLRKVARDIADHVSHLSIEPERWGGDVDFPIRVTAAVGVAVAVIAGHDKLINHAQLAMEAANYRHRQYMFYRQSASTRRQFERNLEWAEKLYRALEAGRVVPYYQPIYDNRTGEVDRYEMLARLVEEDGRVHTPEFFMPVAKTLGLYPSLMRAVVEASFEYMSGRGVIFNVNLSGEDMTDHETARFLEERLLHHKLAGFVGFELLESEAIESYALVRNFMRRFRNHGCKFSVDDFGTGYSNFSHILKLNVDYLKIDASLVGEIIADPNSRKLVQNIHGFASDIGLKTVAEYVADSEIDEAVKEMGIDYSQGFFLGEPVAEI